MMLSSKMLVAFLTLAVSHALAAQGKTYDILLNGINIGQLKVYTLVSKTGEIHYVSDADASIWLFGRKTVTTIMKSIYKDKVMAESSFHEKLNEKTQNISKVDWDGTSYRININDKQSSLHSRGVTYSTAILYHQEPKNISELFSERFGKFCAIKPVGPHKYELTMPDGKKNYYTYVNGVCEHVEVHSGLYRFQFKLRK